MEGSVQGYMLQGALEHLSVCDGILLSSRADVGSAAARSREECEEGRTEF
jgi:hypothetical protein